MDEHRWEDGFMLERAGHVGSFSVSERGTHHVSCCQQTWSAFAGEAVLESWRKHVDHMACAFCGHLSANLRYLPNAFGPPIPTCQESWPCNGQGR